MFDAAERQALDDRVQCADALSASVVAERRVVAERFALVAAWADLHCPESEPTDRASNQPGSSVRQRLEARERTTVGGEGTPRVTRAGVVQLGLQLGVSTGSALALLRDVLELRHRLPCHWAAIQELRIDGWKGRQVASMTHRLTEAQARMVDGQVIDAVTGLAWGPAKDVVEGKVIAADQAAHAARLAEDENRQFVSTRRRSNAAGLRTIIARTDSGGAARVEAMVAHLADKLAAAGDTSAVDLRRAKALVMLANPALACAFLAQVEDQAGDERGGRYGGEASRHADSAALATDSDSEGRSVPAQEDTGFPSAAELAVAFGRVLQRMGSTVLDRLRPKSVLHLHLAAEAVQGRPGCGVARVDDAIAGGPISTDQLKRWLGNDRVTVRPVIDPTGIEPVSEYAIPLEMREAVRLLNPIETFPWGTASSAAADVDHATPYVPMEDGGPPGQTALTNLGPLGRTHHLAKTFDGFVVHQLALGLYLWRSPTGHWFQVDHLGTRTLGRYPHGKRPAALDVAARTSRGDLSPMEHRLRDHVIRHAAA
jgi:hypothetical protein